MQTKMKYDQMIQILEQEIKIFKHLTDMYKADTGALEMPEFRTLLNDAQKLAIYCLKEYVESWSCPMCGYQTKIPHDHEDKRACPKCLCKEMFPYGYLQQERMTKQLALMLSCAQYYTQQSNGYMAKESLKKLAEAGRYKPNKKTTLQSQK